MPSHLELDITQILSLAGISNFQRYLPLGVMCRPHPKAGLSGLCLWGVGSRYWIASPWSDVRYSPEAHVLFLFHGSQ